MQCEHEYLYTLKYDVINVTIYAYYNVTICYAYNNVAIYAYYAHFYYITIQH